MSGCSRGCLHAEGAPDCGRPLPTQPLLVSGPKCQQRRHAQNRSRARATGVAHRQRSSIRSRLKGCRGCVVATARGRAGSGRGRDVAGWSPQARGISPPKAALPEGLARPSPTAVILTSLCAWPAAGSWSPLGVEGLTRASRKPIEQPRHTPTGTSAEPVRVIADHRA